MMAPEWISDRARYMVSKIITLKSNPHYRMGDVIYRRGLKFVDSTENVLLRPEFEGTILKRYLTKIPDVERPSIELLSRIESEVARDGNMKVPGADEIVVHVRAGDVIQLDWFLKTDFAGLIRQHRAAANKCTIVICFSFGDYVERGWWLFTEEKFAGNVTRITALFESLMLQFPDIEFDVFSNSNVDQDFVYMVEAPIFIRDHGGSGFSELVCDLRAFRAEQLSWGHTLVDAV